MATYSSILTWEMPWTEEPGGLQSMGSQRVGHNRVIEQQHSLYLVKSFCSFLSFSPSSLPLLPPFTIFVKSIFIPSFSSFLKINFWLEAVFSQWKSGPKKGASPRALCLGLLAQDWMPISVSGAG